MRYHPQYARWVLERLSADVVSDAEKMLSHNALGLAGETGEVIDHIKKIVWHKKPLDEERRQAMLLELGDVLFYYTAILERLDFTLEDVMTANVKKLDERHDSRRADFGESVSSSGV